MFRVLNRPGFGRASGTPRPAEVKMLAAFACALLLGCAVPTLLRAQDAGCEVGNQASSCDASRLTCVSECRARHFSIDPQRGACVLACGDTASACTNRVLQACRSKRDGPAEKDRVETRRRQL